MNIILIIFAHGAWKPVSWEEPVRIIFEIRLSDNYPHQAPYIYAYTQFHHPFINMSIPPGTPNICLNMISPYIVVVGDPKIGIKGWDSEITLVKLIKILKNITGLKNVEYEVEINPDLVGKIDASTGASGWIPKKTR